MGYPYINWDIPVLMTNPNISWDLGYPKIKEKQMGYHRITRN